MQRWLQNMIFLQDYTVFFNLATRRPFDSALADISLSRLSLNAGVARGKFDDENFFSESESCCVLFVIFSSEKKWWLDWIFSKWSGIFFSLQLSNCCRARRMGSPWRTVWWIFSASCPADEPLCRSGARTAVIWSVSTPYRTAIWIPGAKRDGTAPFAAIASHYGIWLWTSKFSPHCKTFSLLFSCFNSIFSSIVSWWIWCDSPARKVSTFLPEGMRLSSPKPPRARRRSSECLVRFLHLFFHSSSTSHQLSVFSEHASCISLSIFCGFVFHFQTRRLGIRASSAWIKIHFGDRNHSGSVVCLSGWG